MWMVLILLGLALAAFILMDANFTGQRNNQFHLGKVGDTEIDWNDFQRAQSIMYSNSSQDVFTTRNSLWQHFVESAILDKEAEKLGIQLTDEMIEEMKTGARLSPVVKSYFPNQQTGQFDRSFYDNFIQQLNAGQIDPQGVQRWEYLDNFIKTDRIKAQINALAEKAIYTPSWMAEEVYKEKQSKVDFDVVRIPYSQLADIEPTDQELTAYLKEHRAEYEQKEEKRQVDYVAIEAVATPEDTLAIFEEMNEIKQELQTTEDDSLLVLSYEGGYSPAYYKKDKLPETLQEKVFEMKIGEVYGPYLADNAYNLVKLIDRKDVPDSVEVRHILRGVKTQDQIAGAQNIIDSLQQLIESGSESFEDLAKSFSQDQGSAINGGDLGTAFPGQMVPQFNDLIFYQAEVGKLYKVFTQFGIHLVQVTKKKYAQGTDRSGARIAIIRTPIVPSEDTQNAALAQANSILSEVQNIDQLRQYADKHNLDLVTSAKFGANDQNLGGDLGANQNSRNIIQWAFLSNVSKGDVAPEVYIFDNSELYYNQYNVVAGLKDIFPKGVPSLVTVKEEILPLVANQKKVEQLPDLSGKSLQEIATHFAAQVSTITDASSGSGILEGLGKEPVVLAKAIASEEQKVVGPIAGSGGVFYIKVTNKKPAEEIDNLAFYRNTTGMGVKRSIPFSLIQSMKEAINIEDKRSTFF